MKSPELRRIAGPLAAVAFIVAPLWLCGCKDGGQKEEHGSANVFETVVPHEAKSSTDSVDTEMRVQLETEAVMQRVTDIYGVVKDEFMRRGSSVENELLDKAYCSKDWNKLLMAVHYKENLTGVLFFEVNHWSMTQDSELVSFEEFQVTDLFVSDSVKTATVAFTVYGSDTWTPAKISMVYEDGAWKIDNFHNLKYALDVKERMWYYLQHDFM